MQDKYNHKEIEPKWQKVWKENGDFKIDKDATENKHYVLDMFPYPSGDGLHMGHTESYTASDVYYRFKKMQGYNVLHPQGFDAFGLPAENFAIKTGVHPAKTTEKNINTYIKQMESLGLAYDFDEMAVTSDPSYYKWTQWIFQQFYKNGLVYKKEDTINWCNSCQTGIANEQVVNGACERCDTQIEQKKIPGWFFKITDFSDDLIEGLDKVDWPEHTVKNQKNWVGKSEGAKITFPIRHCEGEACGNPGDGLREQANVVLMHGKNTNPNEKWYPLLAEEMKRNNTDFIAPVLPKANDPEINEWMNELEKTNPNQNSIIVGHSRGGVAILRWLEKQPENFKVKKVILVATNSGDSEKRNKTENNKGFFTKEGYDFEKIKKHCDDFVILHSKDDKWVPFEAGEQNAKGLKAKFLKFNNKGHFGVQLKEQGIPELLNEILHGSAFVSQSSATEISSEISVFTTRPDTLFGATYMVLAPEHNLVARLLSNAQIENQKEIIDYIEKTKIKTEMERLENKEKTGVQLLGVSAINPANKEEIPIFIADYVLSGYGTGAIMAVPAHDERDYEFAKKFDLEIREVISGGDIKKQAYVGDGKLINSGDFNGLSVEKAKQKITEFVGGEKTNNYRLRDWSISRQRYWGCPIPIVYSPDGEATLVPEEHLPWVLPTDVDFKPTGVSPLTESKELKERTEKIFGEGWTPEYDTMDTFVDSSWYFLRYPDMQNEKEFCSEVRKKWLPVDVYIGGAEHTYMHLLFARFFVKAMNRIGLLDHNEPFLKLRHQGMVLDKEGKKMSKSKGNVTNPDDMVERFGADSVRTYMLFAGPLEDEIAWNEDNIVGVYRFLEKVWDVPSNLSESSPDVVRELHKLIRKATGDIENLKYNTVVSDMMKFINLVKTNTISRQNFITFLKVLAPFAPHIAEELYQRLGEEGSIHQQNWPKYDENMAKDSTHTIVIQVNGKVRDEMEIENGEDDEVIKEKAQESEIVKKWMEGKTSKKIIYIENKLVNIVV